MKNVAYHFKNNDCVQNLWIKNRIYHCHAHCHDWEKCRKRLNKYKSCHDSCHNHVFCHKYGHEHGDDFSYGFRYVPGLSRLVPGLSQGCPRPVPALWRTVWQERKNYCIYCHSSFLIQIHFLISISFVNKNRSDSQNYILAKFLQK